MLDIMMCLHAEHGGGNNSTFTCRVLSSADTDPYSAYAGAVGSLKGSKHGGANHQVLGMQAEIKENVKNWEDDDEVAAYIAKIVNKEAYDKTGLIYGMGHAVYTLSDPRAIICKDFATRLAEGTEYEPELNLLKSIERLAPEVILQEKGTNKDMVRECGHVFGLRVFHDGYPGRSHHAALRLLAHGGLGCASHGRDPHRQAHHSPSIQDCGQRTGLRPHRAAIR